MEQATGGGPGKLCVFLGDVDTASKNGLCLEKWEQPPKR